MRGMRGKKILLSAMFLVLAFSAVAALAATGNKDTAPAIRDVEYQRAVDLYNNGRYEEALEILKPYVEKRPIPEAYYLIAYSLYKLERNDEANRYFKQAFLLEPTYSPTPALEDRLKEPLRVARPGYEGMVPRIPEYPPKPPLIPKLIENRPEPVKKPEPSLPSTPAVSTPVPPPAPSVEEAVPPPPVGTPSSPEALAPGEAEPSPSTTAPPEAPLPEPSMSEAQPAPPPAPPTPPTMKTPAEKELLAKATEKISKTAEELMGEGQKLSKEAVNLKERPEVGELRAKLKVLLLQTDAEAILKGLLILIFVYLLFSYFLYRITKKLRVNAPFLSFVPLLQVWTFIRAMDKSLILSLLLMSIFIVIPVLNIIAAVYVWAGLILFSILVPFAAVFVPVLGITAAVYYWMGTTPPSFPLLAALLFVPVLNALASVYVWMNLTRNIGRNNRLGLLILLPGVNVLFILYLAFVGIKRRAPADKDMLETPDLSGEPPLPDLGFDLEEEGISPMTDEPGEGVWEDPGFGSAWEDK